MGIIMNWDSEILFLNLPLIFSNIVFLHLQKQKKAMFLARMYKWECSS